MPESSDCSQIPTVRDSHVVWRSPPATTLRPVLCERDVRLNSSVNWVVRILMDGVIHLLHPWQRTDGSEIVVRGRILIFKTADRGKIKNDGGEITRWVSHNLGELETAARSEEHTSELQSPMYLVC